MTTDPRISRRIALAWGVQPVRACVVNSMTDVAREANRVAVEQVSQYPAIHLWLRLASHSNSRARPIC